jgi:hypothetical protein
MNEIALLIEHVEKNNLKAFKKNLWSYYLSQTSTNENFTNEYNKKRAQLSSIERNATNLTDNWNNCINLFNTRFVDMPFKLKISNNHKATLGIEAPILSFVFSDATNQTEFTIGDSQLKTLSTGEARALNLLYFIFDIEIKKANKEETFFIIDDIADSFDYKNKHAILQYLQDLTNIEHFYQLIMTHNFDFFRSLSFFINRKFCLMVNKNQHSLELKEASAIGNYFVNKIKKSVTTCDKCLYSSIPFTRNILEYTRGEEDSHYLYLTNLLHWKEETEKITVGEYLKIYNVLFKTSFDENNDKNLIDILFESADSICKLTNKHLELEDKILMSIAIRISAEKFMLENIRVIKEDPNYWCNENSQFAVLLKEYKATNNLENIRVLERVSITVSNNIHINSFMYEPILDLDIEHLVKLYCDIKGLL